MIQRRIPEVPLELECLRPDQIANLSLAELRSLPVHYGHRRLRLDEFFDIEGQPGPSLRVKGDLRKAKRIGEAMTSGRIEIEGSVGMHVGAKMSGGNITIRGDAGDWLGAELKGGTIRVTGDAGNQVGAAYRGATSGMKNGFIRIEGNAGTEVGLRMRRGTIAISGQVGDFAGWQMKGGTIVLEQSTPGRTGAWMRRGTIVCLKPSTILPSFTSTGPWVSSFLPVLAAYLRHHDVNLPCDASLGRFIRYVGDELRSGQGEILVYQPN